MTSVRDRLFRHVDMLAGLIGERNSRHPSAIAAAVAYLKRELSEMGHDVTEQRYDVADRLLPGGMHPARQATNLEVIVAGRRPELPELVVGAHYDSAVGTPGADDNASAVAALLEIARGLQDHHPRRTVRIVFYDTEEMPHFSKGEMGSQHHAMICRRENRRLRGMICLESIGYFAKPRPAAGAPGWAKKLLRPLGGKHIAVISNFGSFRFLIPFTWALFRGGWWRTLALALPSKIDLIHFSDHRGYWEQGYPALMVTDTALMRNPNYHQPTDLPGTIDFDLLAKLTVALVKVVKRMSR